MNSRDNLEGPVQPIENIKKFEEEINNLFTQLQGFTLSYKEYPEIKEEKEIVTSILFSPMGTGIGQELHDYLQNKEYNVEPLDAGLDLVKICDNFNQSPQQSDVQRQARIEQAQNEMRAFATKYCLTDGPTQLNLDGESLMLIKANYDSPTPSMFKQMFNLNIQAILADDPFHRFLQGRTELARKQVAAVSEEIKQALNAISEYREHKAEIEKEYAAKSFFSISRLKHNSRHGKKLVAKLEKELMSLNASPSTKYAHEAKKALTSLLNKFRPLLLRKSFATQEENLFWEELRNKIYSTPRRTSPLTTSSIRSSLNNQPTSDPEHKPTVDMECDSTTREKSDSTMSTSSTASIFSAESTSSTVGTPRSSLSSNTTLFSVSHGANIFPLGTIHKAMSPRTAVI